MHVNEEDERARANLNLLDNLLIIPSEAFFLVGTTALVSISTSALTGPPVAFNQFGLRQDAGFVIWPVH